MKMEKFIIFVRKDLKINILKIKKLSQSQRSLSLYRGTAPSICNSKYYVPKNIICFFIMDLTMIIILS